MWEVDRINRLFGLAIRWVQVILNAIDATSKYAYSITTRSNSREAVATA